MANAAGPSPIPPSCSGRPSNTWRARPSLQHSRTRSGAVAQDLLKGFAGGTLMVDGHPIYDIVSDSRKTERAWTTAYCWTHWRRRFVKFAQDTASPICDEMIARIAELYRETIRGKAPDTRRPVRQTLSRPRVQALRPWLEARLREVSYASEVARHIRYGLKRWEGLSRFLDDGRLEFDTKWRRERDQADPAHEEKRVVRRI